MKFKGILLNHLAASYCTLKTTTNPQQPSVKDANNNVTITLAKQLPENPDLLKPKQSLHLKHDLITPQFNVVEEKSYYTNMKCLHAAISTLDKNCPSEKDRINIITDLMRRFPREKDILQGSKISCVPTNDVDRLYSKLFEMEIMDYACQNFQLDLQFLNAVIKQGIASNIFHGKGIVVPHNSVTDEICLFFEAVSSKLSKIKAAKNDDDSKFEQIRKELEQIRNVLERNMRMANDESKTAYKYIVGQNNMDVEAFKKFSIKLNNLNEEFKRVTGNYIYLYEELYSIENEGLKKFVKDNAKLFYYALSAFNIVESMNKVLINLPNLYVSPTKTENWHRKMTNFFTKKISSYFAEPKESFDYIVSELATRLFMHCVNHESSVYEGLARESFKNSTLKDTYLLVPVSAETPSQEAVREKLIKESKSLYQTKILIPLKRSSTNTLQILGDIKAEITSFKANVEKNGIQDVFKEELAEAQRLLEEKEKKLSADLISDTNKKPEVDNKKSDQKKHRPEGIPIMAALSNLLIFFWFILAVLLFIMGYFIAQQCGLCQNIK